MRLAEKAEKNDVVVVRVDTAKQKSDCYET